MGSSWIRDPTHVSCSGRWSLFYRVIRECRGARSGCRAHTIGGGWGCLIGISWASVGKGRDSPGGSTAHAPDQGDQAMSMHTAGPWAEVSVHQFHITAVSAFIQLDSQVQLFVIPWTAARQASLSISNSRSVLKLMSIALVMPFFEIGIVGGVCDFLSSVLPQQKFEVTDGPVL